MITPAYLKPGDSVAIVSTARKINLIEIKPAVELLISWGLVPVIGKTIGLEHHQFAGTEEERVEDFQRFLDDTHVKAIWCARGGYGSVQLIDSIDFSNFINNPKWIVGYSDISVFHSHIHNLGIETLHATMPINIKSNTKDSLTSLKNALMGEAVSYEFLSDKKNSFGSCKGQLVGGNLSVLYSLLGSKSAIKTDHKILFLEDLDEYLYHIDRMLQNLKRNGYFNNLKGLIVGGMTQMNDNEVPYGKSAEEIILYHVNDLGFPVAFNAPFGHMDDNRALILGRTIELNVSENRTSIIFHN